jgi:beta-lactamase regulating signal transducer with metallopeptidase domain
MHTMMHALEAFSSSPVLKFLVLDAAWKGLVVLAAGAGLTLALRRSAAAQRHRVWTASLAAVLVLPALVLMLPGVPLPGAIPLGRSPSATSASPSEAPSLVASSTAAPDGAVILHQDGVAPPVHSPTETSAQREAEGAGPLPWFAFALVLWAAGAILLAARFAAGYVRVWSVSRTASPLPPGELAGEARELARDLGIRRGVRIVLGSADAMPMTWGLVRPTVLLPHGAETWSASRRHHVLLHELAHVRRRDHLCQLLAQAACVLHWFDPLAWTAARRLRVERELACDDMVLAAGVRPSDYAEELLRVAQTFRGARGAAMAMAPLSQLRGRLTALLDEHRSHAIPPRRRRWPAWTAAVMAVAALAALRPWAEAPAEASAPDAAGAGAVSAARSPLLTTPIALSPLSKVREWLHGDRDGDSIHIHDGQTTANWYDDDHRVRLRIDGKITFTDDERGIVAMEPGSRLLIEEERDGVRRRLEVTPASDGKPTYVWSVDGDERRFDSEAGAWLARLIPEIYRYTGIDAETRVGRLLERDGASGVLEEISRVPSDYVKRIYFVALLDRTTLTPEETTRALTQAGEEIHSDYELAQVVVLLAGKSSLNEAGQMAAARALGGMSSDFEKRRALTALVGRGDLGPAAREAVLRAAAGIGSDYEEAELLSAFAATYPLDATLAPVFRDAAAEIGSDYELRRTLDAAVDSRKLTTESLEGLVRLAGREIDSDYELASFLVGIARSRPLEGSIRGAYLEAAGTIGSEYENQRALAALARNEGQP